MKRIIKWLRRDTPQQSEVDQRDVGVRPKQKIKGEHGDDSSLYLSWPDQADSSIFDTGKLVIDKSEIENTVPHKALDLENDALSDSEEDIGIDPYNTGRFDTENN